MKEYSMTRDVLYLIIDIIIMLTGIGNGSGIHVSLLFGTFYYKAEQFYWIKYTLLFSCDMLSIHIS